MLDVFISYARAEVDRVRPINEAIKGFGLRTFFDLEGIDGSDEFPIEIDRALREARCVVGIWSPLAITRPWVVKEARIAAHRKVLVTAKIENLTLEDFSTEFAGRHLTNLQGFAGDVSHRGFLELMRAITEFVPLPSLAQLVRAKEGSSQSVQGSIAMAPDEHRWERIKDSLDPRDYQDFIEVFSQSPHAFDARRQKRQLEDWESVAKSKETAVNAFAEGDVFPALRAQCETLKRQFFAARAATEKMIADAERERSAKARRGAKIQKVARTKYEANPAYVRDTVNVMVKQRGMSSSYGIILVDNAFKNSVFDEFGFLVDKLVSIDVMLMPIEEAKERLIGAIELRLQ